MELKFSKMQGIGNDYIYIDCFHQQVEDPVALSKRLSDRRFGIGGDGIILICPSETADCRMDIYNADGSRAKMCGNGIRCVGKFVYERGIAQKEQLRVETLSGIKTLHLRVENGAVQSVLVEMGAPVLEPEYIPVKLPGARVVDVPCKFQGYDLQITCVSVGNPHCVTFTDSPLEQYPLETVGPLVEHDAMFPEGVNFEVVRVLSRSELEMRVWERGSGETWACGTGACASLAAVVLNGIADREAVVHLRGGVLCINWPENSSLWMEGQAEFVFDGTVKI